MPRPTVAVLIPAHDEEGQVAATVASVRQQLLPKDRVVVVADNCTDGTAAAARNAGAEVVERFDPSQRGKGYALACAVASLGSPAPDTAVIVDADTMLSERALEVLMVKLAASGRPVQAVYLLVQPSSDCARHAVSAMAFTVKNRTRPTGLMRLGLPCPLMGTGMALPWPLLDKVQLATGNIVEDMQLGIDLAIAGYPPVFCPEASVTGILPSSGEAARSQRTRWEHGHIRTLVTQVPRLLREALRQRRAGLLVMALDLSVPPLSLFVLLLAGLLAATGAFAGLTGRWLPLAVASLAFAATSIAVFAGWAAHCRELVPARKLLAIPAYILWKIPIYIRAVLAPQRSWIRTARSPRQAK